MHNLNNSLQFSTCKRCQLTGHEKPSILLAQDFPFVKEALKRSGRLSACTVIGERRLFVIRRSESRRRQKEKHLKVFKFEVFLLVRLA